MADLEMISKGIVNAINQYSNSMNKRLEFENTLVMDEIQKRREEEFDIRKQDRQIKSERDKPFYDPLYQKQAQEYIKQNPEDADMFADTPMGGWVSDFKKRRDEFKQRIPATPYLSEGEKNIVIENGKFQSLSNEDIVKRHIWGQVKRGEKISDQSMKLIGMDKQLMYENDLQNFQEGNISLKDMYKKHPTKSNEIYTEKKRNLSPETASIVNQIEGLVKYVKGDDMNKSVENAKNAISDVINNETVLRSRGVDVDAIYELLNIDPGQFKGSVNKEGWMSKVKKWFSRYNPYERTP